MGKLTIQHRPAPQWRKPVPLRQEMQRAGTEALALTVRQSREQLQAVGAVASGDLLGSVRSQFQQRGSVAEFKMTAGSHWVFVEHGRPPGEMPPVSDIRRWLAHKGLNLNPFAVARNIARRGIKGRFPFRQAISRVCPALREAFARAKTRLTQRYK